MYTFMYMKKRHILDQRFYECSDGTLVESATTILQVFPKPGLTDWQLANPDWKKQMQEAAEVGTNVHNAIESFLKYEGEIFNIEPLNLTDTEHILYNRFYEWYQDNDVEPEFIEIPLANKALGYGGTIDFVGKVNGQRWLIDWKTSNSFHDSYFVQVQMYKTLFIRELGHAIERAGVLHLKSKVRTKKPMQGPGWKMHELEPEYSQHYQDLANACKLCFDQVYNIKSFTKVLPYEYKK